MIMNAPRNSVNGLALQRAQSEFLEMPGLRLTSQQAQRLWGLDEATCLAVLESLVEAKFLYRSGRGMYGRTTEGRMRRQLPPTAVVDTDVIRRSVEEAV
jgi:hypothetical protein